MARSGERGAQWITVEAAADRTGWTERWVVGKGRAWEAQGLAKLQSGAAGMKAQWIIREDADGALARSKFPEPRAVDTRPLNAEQRAKLDRCEAIYRAWAAECQCAMRAGIPIEEQTRKVVARLQGEEGGGGGGRSDAPGGGAFVSHTQLPERSSVLGNGGG